MGSVGDDHRCPLCGRVGMGGYAIDLPHNFLIVCTEGPHNCLDLLTEGGPQGYFETVGHHLFNNLVQLHPNARWSSWPPGLDGIIAQFLDAHTN